MAGDGRVGELGCADRCKEREEEEVKEGKYLSLTYFSASLPPTVNPMPSRSLSGCALLDLWPGSLVGM